MSEHALKCEHNAIFKQNYTLKLLISFKISNSCCFGFRRNLDFPDFPPKKFHNINYWYGSLNNQARSLFLVFFY